MKHSPFNLTVQIYILNIETKGNVGIYTLYTIQLVAVPLKIVVIVVSLLNTSGCTTTKL